VLNKLITVVSCEVIAIKLKEGNHESQALFMGYGFSLVLALRCWLMGISSIS
jgi:hypothetical protein